MDYEQRIADLEAQVQALSDQLALFGTIDPELAASMLTFWLVTFIGAHAAGRVVRWLGKA